MPRGTTREQRKASIKPYLCSKVWRKNSRPTQGGHSARHVALLGAKVWGGCLLTSNTSSILLGSSEFDKMSLRQMYPQSSTKIDKANRTNACVPISKRRHDSNYYSPEAIAVFITWNILTRAFLHILSFPDMFYTNCTTSGKFIYRNINSYIHISPR